MVQVRRVPITNLKTFGDMSDSFLAMVKGLYSQASRIDFVFDTYIDGSVKDSEHIRRCDTTPIDINTLCIDTPLPAEMASFWASANNKSKLQDLLRFTIIQCAHDKFPGKQVILSGTGIPGETDTTECLLLPAGGSVSIREPRLEVELEEAYQRLIPHAVDAVKFGARRRLLLTIMCYTLEISKSYDLVV